MIINVSKEKIKDKSSNISPVFEDTSIEVYIDSSQVEKLCVYRKGDEHLIFVGRIDNKHNLSYVFNLHDLNDAQFLFELITHTGVDKAIPLVEGVYLIMYIVGNQFKILTDPLGQYPFYYHLDKNSFFIAFSRTRNLPLDIKQKLIVKAEEEIFNPSKSIDFAPYEHFKRLTSEKIIEFACNNNGEVIDFIISHKYKSFFNQKLQPYTGENFLFYLEKRVSEIGSQIPKDIVIPLSGGIDSGMVAALFCAQGKRVHTYSIGTDFSDEYVESQQTADFLKTNHKTLHIPSNKIFSLVEELISFNEIFDALSIEILLPFGLMFDAAQRDGFKSMCTGYGSDLILGGTLQNTPPNLIFNSSTELIKRTFWTNEFSPFYSQNFGIDLYHPFWSNRLIYYGLNIETDLKNKNGIEKYIFRYQAEKRNLLPKETVWRKKIGIHKGSSIKKLLTETFDCTDSELPKILYRFFAKNILESKSLIN